MIEKIDSSYPIDKLIKFCKEAIDYKIPATVNLQYENWESKPHTLLYVFYIEKRFDGDESGYFIYKKQENIIAGCGHYPFDIDRNMYCQGRGFTVKRTTDFHKLSYAISDDCLSFGYKGGVSTFEPHNLDFAKKLVRVSEQKKGVHYKKHRSGEKVIRHTYKKLGRRFIPFEMYDGRINYRNCEQYVTYHLFDEGYEKTFTKNLNKARIDD